VKVEEERRAKRSKGKQREAKGSREMQVEQVKQRVSCPQKAAPQEMGSSLNGHGAIWAVRLGRMQARTVMTDGRFDEQRPSSAVWAPLGPHLLAR